VATPEPTPTIHPLSGSAVARVSSDNPLIVEIDVEFEEPLRLFLEYGNAEAGMFRTPVSERLARLHFVPVVRLRPETSYDFTVFGVRESGEMAGSLSGRFTTGSLPDYLARIDFQTTGSPTGDLVMMDIQEEGDLDYILTLDGDAVPVWYFDRIDAHLRAIRQRDNYNLLFIEAETGIREITPFGDDVLTLHRDDIEGIIHHDFIETADDSVLYLSNIRGTTDAESNGVPAGTEVVGIAIREWDRGSGDVRVAWNLLDFTSPNELAAILQETVQLREQSAHGNSLAYGPEGDLIVSFRHMNQVMSLRPGLQEVEWRLGGPDSDFTFPEPSDRFYHQHTVFELTNGNVLMFDNGNTRPESEGGEYSRALELRLDYERMTVSKVWEYRHEPDIFARSISGVQRLANGNTLVNFGRTTDLLGDPVSLVEADASGEAVWELRMASEGLPRRYRATYIESLAGEVRLR
jgi:hypothetical protein